HRRVRDDPAVNLQTGLLSESGAGRDAGPEEDGARRDGVATFYGRLVGLGQALDAFEVRANTQRDAVVVEPALDALPDLPAKTLLLGRFLKRDQGYPDAAQREGGRGLAPDKAAADYNDFTSLSYEALQSGRVLDGPHHEDLRVVGAGNGRPNGL